MTARIPCCVPFCKRTAPASGDPDQEIICGTHIKPVSKQLRRAHKRLNKHVEAIMDRHPEPDDLPVEAAQDVLRLIRLSKHVWGKDQTPRHRESGRDRVMTDDDVRLKYRIKDILDNKPLATRIGPCPALNHAEAQAALEMLQREELANGSSRITAVLKMITRKLAG